MSAGIDWAWGAPAESALKAAGVTFVCRYSAHDLSKVITATETQRHLAAGLGIVVVFEDSGTMLRAGLAALGELPAATPGPDPSAGPHRSLRGHAGGVADAQFADAQVKAAGLAGIPVFFACDFDATAADQALIDAYLQGAASVIGKARVGIYGGYWPCSRARTAGLVTYIWGTVAWSGSNWNTAGWKPQIMQGGAVTIGGASCDWDTASAADYGQYRGSIPGTDPALAQGATGPAVAKLQTRLNVWGANPKLAVDGSFGAATLNAVLMFQRARSLPPVGTVGAGMWAILNRTPAPVPAGFHGAYTADGTLSLAGIAAKLKTGTNVLLRMTVLHNRGFDPALAGYISKVFAGTAPPATHVPAGCRFWVD